MAVFGKRTVAAAGAACAVVCVAMAGPAAAAPDRENNPNASTFTVTCPSGVIQGSGAPGSALLIEGGGVAVLQGLVATESGQVIVRTNPGLSQRGVLEECTFASPVQNGALRTAFVLFVP